MRRSFHSGSSPLRLSLFLLATTCLAAACSGSKNSDDDDDGGDGGGSGESGSGGSSAKGGTDSGGSKGGSSGTSGTGGTSGGGSFLSDCNDLCDRSSTCSGSTTDLAACSDSCSQLNALVSSNICKAEIEVLYDCGGTADICSSTACDTEATNAATCLIAYCTDNPSASFCASEN